jgi:chemotaxis protein histidine kinase CheA
MIATLVTLFLTLGIVSLAAPASASAAGDFVSRINSARSAAGRPRLAVRSDLASVAWEHSRRMASKDDLYHNPNLSSSVSNWQAVGENVGRGGDVPSLHVAFMNSPSHRANILDRDFTEVGVGTYIDGNGILWVTEVFRRPFRSTTTTTTRTPAPTTRRTPAPTPTRSSAPRPRPTGPSAAETARVNAARAAAAAKAAAADAARVEAAAAARAEARAAAAKAAKAAKAKAKVAANAAAKAAAAKARGAAVQVRLAALSARQAPAGQGSLTRAVGYLAVMSSIAR